MIFTEAQIIAVYKKSLAAAEERLSTLDVAEGRAPKANGLNGWVFEQTIRHCLSRELAAAGSHPAMKEQVPLRGRARIDLLVGRVAIELKARGSFGANDTKYDEYKLEVEKRGWAYFYLTQQERHAPYRRATELTFGPSRAFFLDSEGDWARFVNAVVANHG